MMHTTHQDGLSATERAGIFTYTQRHTEHQGVKRKQALAPQQQGFAPGRSHLPWHPLSVTHTFAHLHAQSSSYMIDHTGKTGRENKIWPEGKAHSVWLRAACRAFVPPPPFSKQICTARGASGSCLKLPLRSTLRWLNLAFDPGHSAAWEKKRMWQKTHFLPQPSRRLCSAGICSTSSDRERERRGPRDVGMISLNFFN